MMFILRIVIAFAFFIHSDAQGTDALFQLLINAMKQNNAIKQNNNGSISQQVPIKINWQPPPTNNSQQSKNTISAMDILGQFNLLINFEQETLLTQPCNCTTSNCTNLLTEEEKERKRKEEEIAKKEEEKERKRKEEEIAKQKKEEEERERKRQEARKKREEEKRLFNEQKRLFEEKLRLTEEENKKHQAAIAAQNAEAERVRKDNEWREWQRQQEAERVRKENAERERLRVEEANRQYQALIAAQNAQYAQNAAIAAQNAEAERVRREKEDSERVYEKWVMDDEYNNWVMKKNQETLESNARNHRRG